ncbi:hypothetical protein [Armatimonas sp.]|uniref:hypothetical protein n=1 Tax=Armatimonas sp. TaxID=1872638 RepID=UPI00286D2594|nr:hypothetical protein [Armatimonas sp.]
MEPSFESLQQKVRQAERGELAHDEAYLAVAKALATALRQASEAFIPQVATLHELAFLLASLEDPRGLVLVVQAEKFMEYSSPLERLLKALEKRAAPEDIRGLRETLDQLYGKERWLIQAMQIAQTLVEIAECTPFSEPQALLERMRDYASHIVSPLIFFDFLHRLQVVYSEPITPESLFFRDFQWLLRGEVGTAERARKALQTSGRAHIGVLIQALETDLATQRVVPDHLPSLGRTVLRLSELLADLEDVRALPTLVRVSVAFDEPLLRLVESLRQQDARAVTEALVEALKTLRTSHQPKCAVAVGRALLEIAERNPSLEFRAVLSLLKPGFGVPIEFFGLHRRLKALLADGNLPIPTDAPKAMQSLPIASDKNEAHHD